jgi:hypothetical protein
MDGLHAAAQSARHRRALLHRQVRRIMWNFGTSVPDPGSGAFLDPYIRDPGCVKNRDPGSGMNIPDPRA